MGTEWSQQEDEGSKLRYEGQRGAQKPQKNDVEREIDIQVQRPHNLEEILKDALRIHKSSAEKLYDQLQRGVFLNQKRKVCNCMDQFRTLICISFLMMSDKIYKQLCFNH